MLGVPTATTPLLLGMGERQPESGKRRSNKSKRKSNSKRLSKHCFYWGGSSAGGRVER